MRNVVRHKSVVQFPVYTMQRNDLPSGGHSMTRVVSHYEQCDIEIEYDVDEAIRSLGVKAARNRGGKSKAANGILKARRISDRRRV